MIADQVYRFFSASSTFSGTSITTCRAAIRSPQPISVRADLSPVWQSSTGTIRLGEVVAVDIRVLLSHREARAAGSLMIYSDRIGRSSCHRNSSKLSSTDAFTKPKHRRKNRDRPVSVCGRGAYRPYLGVVDDSDHTIEHQVPVCGKCNRLRPIYHNNVSHHRQHFPVLSVLCTAAQHVILCTHMILFTKVSDLW